MASSYDVRVWDLRKRERAGRPTRFEVRWAVDGAEHSKSFTHKAQADHFRAGLLTAAKTGEPFDVGTGQPVGATRGSGPTCYETAQTMLVAKWSTMAGKSRQTEVDNLAYLLCALVDPKRDVPTELRVTLRKTLGRKDVELTATERDALRWLERASLPVSDVDDVVVRRVLDTAGKALDGSTLSESTQKQRRTYLSGLFTYAVEQKLVAANPVRQVKAKRTERAGTIKAVNSRQIGDVATARRIIDGMPAGVQRDFVATVFLAGMRPSEVAGLRIQDADLPAEGWGELVLAKSSATSGRAWTDSGEVRDDRGLKHRGKDARRTVPVPPELVTILRERIGDRKSGWVFQTRRGDQVSDVSVGRAWQEARTAAGISEDVLPRVYDLRHLWASAALNGGLPVTEVADRLGHAPQVCLQVYAHVVTSERPRWNAVIESALGGPDGA